MVTLLVLLMTLISGNRQIISSFTAGIVLVASLHNNNYYNFFRRLMSMSRVIWVKDKFGEGWRICFRIKVANYIV